MINSLHINNVKNIFTLSPMQENMLFSSFEGGAEQIYFRQLSYRINGDFEPTIAQEAFKVLFHRHDSLRTVFSRKKEDKLLQVVLKQWEPEFYFEDIRNRGCLRVREAFMNFYKNQDQNRGFDVTKDSLMRVAVLQLEDESFEFIWSYHHAIIDAWSVSILFQEYETIYAQIKSGKNVLLSDTTQYEAYIQWLQKQNTLEASSFWGNYLNTFETPASLPKLKLLATQDKSFKKIRFSIDAQKTEKLKNLAIRCKVTFGVLMQTIWGVIVSKYNNTRDIVFGLVVSGRPAQLAGVEEIVGLFINTVPVRVAYDSNMPFSTLLQKVHYEAIEREVFEYYSLTEIQATHQLKQNLFDHIVAFENAPAAQQADNADTFSVSASGHYAITNYDFNINIIPQKETIISLDFNENAYEHKLIENIAHHFQGIINQVIDQEFTLVDSLVLLSEDEKQLLSSFNKTEIFYSYKQTILEHFNSSVNCFPEHIAVIEDEKMLSYEELENRSNQLANFLLTNGVKHGDFVASMVERSLQSVINLLGILKIGAVYVPIDQDMPKGRAEFIIQDSAVKAFIFDKNRGVNCSNAKIISLSADKQAIALSAITRPKVVIHGTDLAYVIYTSGSTGNPKGVLIKHESIVNQVLFHNEYLSLNNEDTILQFASHGFDASIIEILMSLFVGGSLVIVDSQTKFNIPVLYDYIEKNNVTTAIFPPAFLQAFDGLKFSSLKRIISTGEAASLEVSVRLAETIDIFNGYGPTESCIGASFYKVDTEKTKFYQLYGAIPIGKPFANAQIFVLSDTNQQMPIGHIGEICVSGIGLSVGYLNQSQLTEQKFIPNPFSKNTNDKFLYRTGDLGRWNFEGNLEYIGRADEQVQIRGIRVELSEIEAVINKIEAVTQVCVNVVKADSSVQLVAYVVADDKNFNLQSIRDFGSMFLPTYMLPTHLVVMQQLPLTLNGKIDKKKLPIPVEISSGHDEMPCTDTEKTLSKIWTEVINKTDVSRSDNFFDLGGHSLKATRLISKIYKEMGVKLKLNDVFVYPTLSQMSTFIESQGRASIDIIQPFKKQDYYPLSHAQKRVWLAHQLEGGDLAYNVLTAYNLIGNLNIDAFQKTFLYIISRHEILRTNFKTIEGSPYQVVREVTDNKFVFDYIDFSETSNAEKLAKEELDRHSRVVFDLEKDSLIRVSVIKTSNQKHLFVLSMHHIICDAWSKEIITKEIINTYNTFNRKLQPSATPLRIHYKDFAAWQQQSTTEDKDYWQNQLEQYKNSVDLPLDFSRKSAQSYGGDVVYEVFSTEITEGVREIAKKYGASPFMVGLTGVYLLLHRYTEATDIIVGTTVAGRDHPDLENQIGFYINTLPLRTKFDTNETFETLLYKTKKSTLEAYKHQQYPFDKITSDLGLKKDFARSPLFDVLVELISVASALEILPQMTDVEVTEYPLKTMFSKHELAFRFFDNQDEFAISLEYNSDLFLPETIELMLSRLKIIFEAVVSNHAIQIQDLSLSNIQNSDSVFELESSFNFNF